MTKIIVFLLQWGKWPSFEDWLTLNPKKARAFSLALHSYGLSALFFFSHLLLADLSPLYSFLLLSSPYFHLPTLVFILSRFRPPSTIFGKDWFFISFLLEKEVKASLLFDFWWKKKYFLSFNCFVLRLTILFFIFRLGFVLAEVKFGLLCYFWWKMLF